jgi:chemotaxis protein CheD
MTVQGASRQFAAAPQTPEEHVVGISDRKVAGDPDAIVTYALGSCVGVALYDEKAKIGGIAHIMLPDSAMISGGGTAPDSGINRMKFADTGVADLVSDMISRGARKENVEAKIAGGANMFGFIDGGMVKSIGDRNVEGVRAILGRLGIRIVSEDVGGDYGRTLCLDIAEGSVTVRSLGRITKEI